MKASSAAIRTNGESKKPFPLRLGDHTLANRHSVPSDQGTAMGQAHEYTSLSVTCRQNLRMLGGCHGACPIPSRPNWHCNMS
jgi:hypothetical protein